MTAEGRRMALRDALRVARAVQSLCSYLAFVGGY